MILRGLSRVAIPQVGRLVGWSKSIAVRRPQHDSLSTSADSAEKWQSVPGKPTSNYAAPIVCDSEENKSYRDDSLLQNIQSSREWGMGCIINVRRSPWVLVLSYAAIPSSLRPCLRSCLHSLFQSAAHTPAPHINNEMTK